MSHPDKSGEDAPEREPGFLERWSQRKAGARNATAQVGDSSDTVAESPAVTAADAPQAQPPVLTDTDMQPLETLDAESDYAPFMSAGVSDELRQKALRILFRQPSCCTNDGLNDYDEDYTQFTSLDGVVTHEMKRLLQRELDAELRRSANNANRSQEIQPASSDLPGDEPVAPALEETRTAVTARPHRGADGEECKG